MKRNDNLRFTMSVLAVSSAGEGTTGKDGRRALPGKDVAIKAKGLHISVGEFCILNAVYYLHPFTLCVSSEKDNFNKSNKNNTMSKKTAHATIVHR